MIDYLNRISPFPVTELSTNQIFVYGANQAWRHGKGAAKDALKFGAIYGEGPFRGQTYGIPTKDKSVYVTLPLFMIKPYVDEFIQFAKDNHQLTFLVTKVGCLNAGYTPEKIAPLFIEAINVENIHLPLEFWEILK